MRRIILFLAAASLLPLATARAERVPSVPQEALPVAGTCAPLPAAQRTLVTVGELGWFRLDGASQEIDEDALIASLLARSRAAAERGLSHDVWIAARRDAGFGAIVTVLHACQQVGLHRVGVEVQAEGGGGVMGFPLFLPRGTPPAAPGSAQTARRLPIRLETGADTTPSHPTRIYAAARAAVERFGPVVAEVSVAPNATLQSAVTALDLLYRAGCADVRLRYRLIVPDIRNTVDAQVWIQDALLPAAPMAMDVPPTRPRKQPWPDHGAGAPGAESFVLEPIPDGRTPGEGDEAAPGAGAPLPSYVARGEPVPPAARAEAEAALFRWHENAGASLLSVLARGVFPSGLLVRRKRMGMEADRFFRAAREAFPAPDRVVPSTLRVQAYLFREARVVGKVDVTLGLMDGSLGVIFGRWAPEEAPAGLTLPPVETDPYAAGVPGHLRVYVEALLQLAGRRGARALPLVPLEAVLAELPPVAHPSATQQVAGRATGLDAMARWLAATPYDRLVLLPPEGSASVRRGGRIEGVLYYDLESEEGMLRFSALRPRVAPR